MNLGEVPLSEIEVDDWVVAGVTFPATFGLIIKIESYPPANYINILWLSGTIGHISRIPYPYCAHIIYLGRPFP